MTASKPHATSTVQKKKVRSIGEMCGWMFLRLIVLIVPAFFIFHLLHPFIHSQCEKYTTLIPRIIMITLTAISMIGIIFNNTVIKSVYIIVFVFLLTLPISGALKTLFQFFECLERGGCESRWMLFHASNFLDWLNIVGCVFCYLLFCVLFFIRDGIDFDPESPPSGEKETSELVNKKQLVDSNV